MNISGVITNISKAEKKSDKFTVQTFVVQTAGKYPQVIQFQLTNDRVGMADQYLDKEVKVEFDIQGREWKPDPTQPAKYFTTLNCWKIEPEYASLPQASSKLPDNFVNQDGSRNRAADPFGYNEVAVDGADDMPF